MQVHPWSVRTVSRSLLAATIPLSLPFPYLMLLLMCSFMCADQRNKAQADKTLEQAEAERERLQLKTADTQELLRKNQEALAEAELHNIKVCGERGYILQIK